MWVISSENITKRYNIAYSCTRLGIRITLMRIRIHLFTFRIRLFTLMRLQTCFSLKLCESATTGIQIQQGYFLSINASIVTVYGPQRTHFELLKLLNFDFNEDPDPCRIINVRRLDSYSVVIKLPIAIVICTVDSHKCKLYNKTYRIFLDNGMRYISSPNAQDPPFSLQNGKGTGMMSNYINVSAFMVLPDFLPPPSGTFFLHGCLSHPAILWTFHLRTL